MFFLFEIIIIRYIIMIFFLIIIKISNDFQDSKNWFFLKFYINAQLI